MGVYHSLQELVGHTPLMKLSGFSPDATVLAKLECFNPAGSAKDRVALQMIQSAEESGLLSPGGTIIEPTSGNTGIGLAA
ncbi:MAG: pyridoxal-phosphate dependent enzyme, partial [Clostridia bacterium]|nr:pyridoxal-phosphate dependent enzyme [Clostridia bacterium]